MKNVVRVGETQFHGVTDHQRDLILGRHEFIIRYCDEKKWDKDSLSMEQILEIRSQSGWSNPK